MNIKGKAESVSDRLLRNSRDRLDAFDRPDRGELLKEFKGEVTPQPVKRLRSVNRISDGQYTKETGKGNTFKCVYYPYTPGILYRRNIITGEEIKLFEKINGDWFPCQLVSSSEYASYAAFIGSLAIDLDVAIARKRPIKTTHKGSYNDGGKITYRCKPDNDPDLNYYRTMGSKEELKRKRDILASVQIENVKRKK